MKGSLGATITFRSTERGNSMFAPTLTCEEHRKDVLLIDCKE